jgi:hypothetical protein
VPEVRLDIDDVGGLMHEWRDDPLRYVKFCSLCGMSVDYRTLSIMDDPSYVVRGPCEEKRAQLAQFVSRKLSGQLEKDLRVLRDLADRSAFQAGAFESPRNNRAKQPNEAVPERKRTIELW